MHDTYHTIILDARIHIAVSYAEKGFGSVKHTWTPHLVEFTRISLSPEAARQLSLKLAQAAKWANHPLYQWGQRKIGKA